MDEYKESEASKLIKRLMDEEGFTFGEAVKEAMRQEKEFESKADGGSIGIEVLFREKNKNGGRIGLKDGLMPEDYLYSMDKDAKGFLIGEDSDKIPEGLPEDYLFKIDDEGKIFIVPTKESEDKRKDVEVENVEDIIERDTPKVGILSGFSPLAFLRKYLAKKELEAKEENKADGGRVGLFMGGPALEGQALAIYNSMNATGATDQAIADRLQSLGLYTPGGSTPPETTQPNIIGSQINQGGDDKPMIQSFQQDPRVGAAFEAYQRNQGLKAMGIEDPFADEISLQGAYYGDMPNVNLKPGSQSMMGKIKSGIGEIMNFPLVKGMSLMSPFGLLKQGITAFKDVLPVNQREIAENVAGNMGIAVDDIGRIVNTGDYQDPSNVMAGYNLNKMTDETFDKRIDTISGTLSNKYGLGANEIKGILEGTLTDAELNAINAKAIMPGTNQTTNLIKQLRSINIAKDRNRFIQDAAKKEAERKEKERQAARDAAALARAQREIAAKGYQDYGQGGADQATQKSYEAPDGSYGGASVQDYGGGEKDGGIIGYRRGGLATMFTRRR